MTLVEFLLARIAEDERYANAARGVLGIETPWHKVNVLRERGLTRADAQHVARWSSARVLTECKAKRAIVEGYLLRAEQSDYPHGEVFGYHATGMKVALRALASVYAGHPDYQQDWAS